MKLAWFPLLAALIIVLAACQPLLPQTSSLPPGVLFQDDFSDLGSGWDQTTQDGGILSYEEGGYRIFVNLPNTDIWSNPHLNFTDTRIEVDAAKVSGPDDNDFGVICRSRDARNYYFFLISSDGYYGIGKAKDGQKTLLGDPAMQPSELINQGQSANHISATCSGERLALAVNGVQLAEEMDGEFTSGDVGLIAGAYTVPGVAIQFDNFSVFRP